MDRKQIKQGGNGRVELEGHIATKTLLRVKAEKLARFRVEITTLEAANAARIPNIVELLEVKLDARPPRYSMKRYAGDFNELLARTKHDPRAVAELLLPVVNALDALSRLPKPIYHRDLKPSNLLYEIVGGAIRPVISDFGCAFIADDTAERITEDARAVGATFFRAPEYTYGRVDDVTASGDVFSLGKLLWYMCNGERGVVFPYTLWFTDEYNLKNRCSSPLTAKLNVLIGSCVDVTPARRLTYVALRDGLQDLLSSATLSAPETERMRVLAHEQEMSVAETAEAALFEQLMAEIVDDINTVSTSIEHLYKGTLLGDSAHQLRKLEQPLDALRETVIRRKSDAMILKWDMAHGLLQLRAHPASQEQNAQPSLRLSFDVHQGATKWQDHLVICRWAAAGTVYRRGGGAPSPYTRDVLANFFRQAIEQIGARPVTLP